MNARRLVVLLLALAAASANPAIRGAEDAPFPYQVDEPPDPGHADNFAVRNGLRAGDVKDKDVFRQVYLWRFSQFTWPAKLNDLPKLRNSLKTDFRIAARAKTNAAHELLNELALGYFPGIALDARRHPVTRVNAMLVVSDLNQREAISSEDQPVPLPAALPILEQVLAAPDDPSGGADDAVKCMAMVGILRHATLSELERTVQERLATRSIALLAPGEVPAGRQELTHRWMRRRATDVLAALAENGVGPWTRQARQVLREVLDDRQSAVALRIDAAAALAAIRQQTASPQPADGPLAKAMGRLAVDLMQQELRGDALVGWQPQSESSYRVLRHGLGRICLVMTGKSSPEEQSASAATVPVAEEVTRYVVTWLQTVERYGYYLDRVSTDLALDAQALEAAIKASGNAPATMPGANADASGG